MEYIKINKSVEQNVLLNYDIVIYRFEIQFDDYNNNWFFDLYIDSSNTLVLSGVKIIIGYDIFKGLGLNLGELYLIDTINDGSSYDIKTDFGDRLRLAREYNA